METYAPKCKPPNWDVKSMTKERLSILKNRLIAGVTHEEQEYRAVLSYLHMKFPHLMDVSYGDGRRFQWRYHTFAEKVKAYDSVGKCDWDMYALVYYDPLRDMEPVAVGGSYLRETGAIRDPYTHQVIDGQEVNKHTTKIRCGHGYVLFVDPSYRRMGLSQAQWLTEAQLYRDSSVHYQKENQTYEALMVTLSLFSDPAKCHLLNKRSLNEVKPGTNTKIIMDYYDEELRNRFESLPDGLKDFRKGLDWTFLRREGLTMEQLCEPWNGQKMVGQRGKYQDDILFQFSVDRDLYEAFNEYCKQDGVKMKNALVDYMKFVTNRQQ